ncbi:MAG TPA: PDZ domain-containing protein [Blastocatellia bacterium]|nr:PDZ domain-containing protein [Blastocatellia bacterium]
MTLTCPRCRAPIVEGQRFCRYCGYRLDQGLQDVIPTEPLGPTSPPTPSADPFQVGSWSDPAFPSRTWDVDRKRRRWRITLLALGLGVLIGGFTIANVIHHVVVPRFRIERPASVAVLRTSTIGVYLRDEGGTPSGAFIDGVIPGSPADRAGLIGGDIIIEANGLPIRGGHDLRRFLRTVSPGVPLTLKFLRDGEQHEAILIPGLGASASDRSSGTRPHGFFGIDPSDLRRVPVPGKSIWGVRLSDILLNRPADLAGLREGDIVIEFNGHPIRTERELFRRINETTPYATVSVKIVRDGQELVIPVKLGRSSN